MPRKQRRITLLDRVLKDHPNIADPAEEISAGRVLVGGFPVTKPSSLVSDNMPVTLTSDGQLRGERKLMAALNKFDLSVAGATAADLGAAAGGFTRALLLGGAARVYAVDVGHGQLQGSLRQDQRVVVLERTNIANLSAAIVPEVLDVVTMDLSYVSVAIALPQVSALRIRPGADLVALVKPMFELNLSSLPSEEQLGSSVVEAVLGIRASGWEPVQAARSPIVGARGAVEFFVHARRHG